MSQANIDLLFSTPTTLSVTYIKSWAISPVKYIPKVLQLKIYLVMCCYSEQKSSSAKAADDFKGIDKMKCSPVVSLQQKLACMRTPVLLTYLQWIVLFYQNCLSHLKKCAAAAN